MVKKKHYVGITLATILILILSLGIVQYRQMSNLTFQFFYPEDTFPDKIFENTIKDSFFDRSATEFSHYLNQLEFVPGDNELYQIDSNESHTINIAVEDGSKNIVNNYYVFEKPNRYIIVDSQDAYPDLYAVVEGSKYNYLYVKLAEGRERLGIHH